MEIGSANRIRQTLSENSVQKKQEVESLSYGTGMLMPACGTLCSQQDPASAAHMGLKTSLQILYQSQPLYEDFFPIERYKHKHLAEGHTAASLTEKPSLSMATLGSEILAISLLLRQGK